MHAALAESPSLKGMPLDAYLESLGSDGLRIIFSSDLVNADQVLLEEPDLSDPKSSLARILRPYALKVIDGPSGSLLVVRDESPAMTTEPAKPPETTSLPEIIVTSSLHRLQYAESGSHTYLERELSTRIPAAAEEAVRLTNRLPGTASGGISSRNHIRGGEVNEVLFLLDGLRLYEPYHLKDFQSVASIVNASAISGVDFYTGGYPVRYGDRMSGVMNLALREPTGRTETELALSFFNTSALSLGRFGSKDQGDWLLAARRGNLDLIVDVIDPDYGSPDYQDLLLHFGWDFGPLATISANVLTSHDKISLTDTDVGEAANANYDNKVFWLKWNASWSSVLQSETIVSLSDISNDRAGSVDVGGIVSGVLNETRDFKAIEIQQDWTFAPADRWMLGFGFRARHQDAEYLYSSVKTVPAPFDQILDNEAFVARDFDLSPEGAQYAAYAELRWQPVEKLIVDLGLRWDQQTYTMSMNDRQYSPRVSMLFRSSDKTEIRLGFGQFYQAQEINELQVSDGVASFYPAQRAKHVVANLKHSFDFGIDLDVSMYRKAFRSLRPRFENVFNTLTLVPELQFDRVRIDALQAESRGIELMASHASDNDSLFWWLGYAWSEVEDSTANGKIHRSWDQRHTGKLGISWRWGLWNFSAAGEVHTGWPKTLLTTERNSSQYSVFHTLDARVSRDFDLRRGSLTAFLEITNLLDRSNSCCTEYSIQAGPGGTSELLAKDGYWLPIVPSLGVVWRF
ncbi:MAG: TonB-dependent receptor [Gammaproteobacteria bacterium]|nr:TonB-dependent receptor [Gammaproteobacteria bacterium]